MKDYIDQVQEQWREMYPDIDTTPAAVIGRVLRLARVMQTQADAVLAAHGVTRAEFDVLSLLARTRRPMAPSELAAELLTSAPGITKRVKKLVEAGLVSREGNPNDGRGAFVRISAKAQESLEPILNSIWEFEAGLLAGMSAAGQEVLAQQLKSLLLRVENGHD